MRRFTSILSLVAVGMLGLTTAVAPQGDQDTQQTGQSSRGGNVASPERERSVIDIVELQHSVAGEVAAALDVAFREYHFEAVAMQSQNAVLIKGAESEIVRAHEMTQMLDMRAERQESKRSVVIYDVRDLVDQASLRQFASIAVDGPGERFAFEDNGMLIVSATEETHNKLKSLLAEIRTHATSRPEAAPGTERRVQLLWLLSGLEDGVGSDVPHDLDPVVEELAELGFSDLKLGANSIVEATVNEEFSITTILELHERIRYWASGVLRIQNDRPRLEFILEAAAVGSPGGLQTSLETTVTTQEGHYVVLSASPVGGRHSVFVLRVTATD